MNISEQLRSSLPDRCNHAFQVWDATEIQFDQDTADFRNRMRQLAQKVADFNEPNLAAAKPLADEWLGLIGILSSSGADVEKRKEAVTAFQEFSIPLGRFMHLVRNACQNEKN